MVLVQGKVVGGKIVLDQDVPLPEGAVVFSAVVADNEPFELTPEQEDELALASAECDRGEVVDAFEFLAQLRDSSDKTGQT